MGSYLRSLMEHRSRVVQWYILIRIVCSFELHRRAIVASAIIVFMAARQLHAGATLRVNEAGVPFLIFLLGSCIKID